MLNREEAKKRRDGEDAIPIVHSAQVRSFASSFLRGSSALSAESPLDDHHTPQWLLSL
jgi:hypothetical protein